MVGYHRETHHFREEKSPKEFTAPQHTRFILPLTSPDKIIAALRKRELVGARPLHLANARPFGRLKAPLGLSLFRFAPQTRIGIIKVFANTPYLPTVFHSHRLGGRNYL